MSAPFREDEWNDYYQEVGVGGAADETGVGVTFTPGATIEVTDNGGPEVAFPTAMYANGLLYCAYRKGTTHGVELAAKIVYKSTADLDGLTGWSAESDLVDSVNLDDRDPLFYFDGAVFSFGWHKHNINVKQAFARAFSGGPELEVVGMPLYEGSTLQCGRPNGYDGGARFSTYGQPFNATNRAIVGFIGPRTPRPGARRWITHGSRWLYEPYVVRISATNLVVVMRVSSTGADHVQSFASLSTDNGLTWGPFQEFSWIGDAPMGIMHSSGRVIYAVRRINGAARTTELTSTLDGLTWTPLALIYLHVTPDSSYPSIVEKANGDLMVFHYEPRFIRMTEVAVS